MRWKAIINKWKLAGEIVDIPGDFVDSLRSHDHSFLRYSLNQLAENCGLLPIFNNVHLVGENNGEVYLSKYFEEQMVRNQTVGQDKKTSMCQCPTCTTYMSKNTQQQTRLSAPEQQDNNAVKNTNDNTNDANMRNLPVVPGVPPFFMQPPPPSTAAFLFVPPIPLAELVNGGWMPRPHDCCYMVGDHHRASYAAYLWQKNSGVQVLGKPPHEMTCPVRQHL
jgi:hypothetical protein